MGLSRRSLHGANAAELFVDAQAMRQAIAGARRHDFSALRFDDQLKRQGAGVIGIHIDRAAFQRGKQNRGIAQALPMHG